MLRNVSESAFTSALALLHSDRATETARKAEEVKLVELLDTTYDTLGDDLPLASDAEQDALGAHERTSLVDLPGTSSVMSYLAGLALAWLYESRRHAAGTAVETDGFPVAPELAQFGDWPVPTIPGYVVNRLAHVGAAVAPSGTVADTDAIDLFRPACPRPQRPHPRRRSPRRPRNSSATSR